MYMTIVFALLGFIPSVFSAGVGERVEYKRGETFHLELRTVFATPEVKKVYDDRLTHRTLGRWPVSYGYPLNDSARNQIPGVRFIDCQGGIKGTVRVEGLRDGVTLSDKDLDVLTSSDFKVGTVRASAYGVDWVEFTDFNLTGARTIVLPYHFVEGKKPMVTVTAKDWKPEGPFLNGDRFSFEMSHRVFSNTPGDGKKVGTNVGMILPMQVKGDIHRGSCERP